MPRKTVYEYQENGRLVTVTGQGATTKIFEPVDQAGESTADGNPVVAESHLSISRDGAAPVKLLVENNRIVREVVAPDGTSTRTEYDWNNLPVRITTSNDGTLLLEYDENGRLIERRDAEGNYREEFNYSEGRIVAFTDAEGRNFQYDYDDTGNLVRETVGAPEAEPSPAVEARRIVLEEMEYYPNGLMKKKTSDGRTYHFDYDSQGNLESSRNSDEIPIRYTNDSAGNQLLREQNGSKREFAYDAYNRPVSAGMGIVTAKYSYDEYGHPREIEFPHSTITMRYDEKGRLLERVDGRGHSWKYTYNNNDLMASLLKPNGAMIRYEYDPSGNLIRMETPGRIIEQEYDSQDRLVRSSSGDVELTVQYNSAGARTAEILHVEGHQIPVQYKYDRSGKVTSVEAAEQQVIYEWTETNQLKSVNVNNGQFKLDVSRGVPYHPELLENENLRFEQDYTDSGRLATSRVTGPNGALEIGLEYNATGSCVSRRDSDGAEWGYEYDDLEQLKRAFSTGNDGPDYSAEIGYDAAGNRSSLNGVEHALDDTHEILLSDAEHAYEYDVLGNLILKTRISDGSTTTFEYDDFDRLVAFESKDSTGAFIQSGTYGYDPLGRRIRKTVQEGSNAPAIKYYIHDETNVFLELNGSFQVNRCYPSLRTIDSLLGFVESGRSFYFLRGKFNSVEAIFDGAGNQRARYTYGPFGELLRETGDIKNDFLFTNREFDRECGLYYHRARHYDPRTGRFQQPDPAPGDFRDPRTLLFSYAYAANNPLRYYDPTGFNFWDDLWKVVSYPFKVIWNLAKLVVGVLLNPMVLIDLTWGGFGTALGLIIGAGAIVLGGEAEIEWGKGVKVVYPDWIRDLLPKKNRNSAFSLGPIAIGSSTFDNWDHEFGHSWQNRILGPLYIPVVAIPSFISAATSTSEEHKNRWYERWADDLADWSDRNGSNIWGRG